MHAGIGELRVLCPGYGCGLCQCPSIWKPTLSRCNKTEIKKISLLKQLKKGIGNEDSIYIQRPHRKIDTSLEQLWLLYILIRVRSRFHNIFGCSLLGLQ
jgi:hypothetical protein